jgi:putative peptidoglycan lipid II flippase
VLLPFSAEMAARQDEASLAGMLTAVVRGLTLLFLPVMVGLMVLREPFVRLLFERGAFTAASTDLTAGPLFFYALALLPFSLEVVVIQFFFARQDTLTPVVVDALSFAVNVALIPLLMPLWGLGGIALAAAAAKALKVLALLVLFSRRVPAFRLAGMGPFALKMLLVALAVAGALLAFLALGPAPGQGQGIVAQSLYLAAGGMVGGAVFVLAAGLLRVREMGQLWQQGRSLVSGLLKRDGG